MSTPADLGVSRYLVRESPIPVLVVTGFLGSGKTTLLRRLLARDAFAATAVVVNELGEIGLDHQLVEVADEQMMLLPNGCLCCQLRNDLVETLRSLLDRATRNEIAAFSRLVVETTGIADPAPILQTLMMDPLRFSRFAAAGLVTTVDAVVGDATLDRHPVAVKQIALADRVFLTKSDLAGDTSALSARLRAVNPQAPVHVGTEGDVAPEHLPGFGAPPAPWRAAPADVHGNEAHGDGIVAASASYAAPLDRGRFDSWLRLLLDEHGEQILRLKGIVRFAGEPQAVAVHGVQHVFHPPEPVAAYAGDDSRLVVIAQDLDQARLLSALRALSPSTCTAPARSDR